MQQRIRITISGQVQGVYFRSSAATEAERLNIAGFAKNQPDGTLLIEAEGSPDDVEAFLNWCRKGPKLAQVSHVSLDEMEPLAEVGFKIV